MRQEDELGQGKTTAPVQNRIACSTALSLTVRKRKPVEMAGWVEILENQRQVFTLSTDPLGISQEPRNSPIPTAPPARPLFTNQIKTGREPEPMEEWKSKSGIPTSCTVANRLQRPEKANQPSRKESTAAFSLPSRSPCLGKCSPRVQIRRNAAGIRKYAALRQVHTRSTAGGWAG
jgi:hypothetical protein